MTDTPLAPTPRTDNLAYSCTSDVLAHARQLERELLAALTTGQMQALADLTVATTTTPVELGSELATHALLGMVKPLCAGGNVSRADLADIFGGWIASTLGACARQIGPANTLLLLRSVMADYEAFAEEVGNQPSGERVQ